jgi:hypothetical protein
MWGGTLKNPLGFGVGIRGRRSGKRSDGHEFTSGSFGD